VPRLTVTEAEPVLLDASVQSTVMTFEPVVRLTDAGLVAVEPFTVQVIGATPPDVDHATEVVAAVV